jgi:hypothetical protein
MDEQSWYLAGLFITMTGDINHNLRYFKYYLNKISEFNAIAALSESINLEKFLEKVEIRDDVFSKKLTFITLNTILKINYENEEASRKLKTLLSDKTLELSREEGISAYFGLQTVYENFISKNRSEYREKLHLLLKSIVESNISIEAYDNGYLFYDFFILVVESCNEFNDLKWCEKFYREIFSIPETGI